MDDEVLKQITNFEWPLENRWSLPLSVNSS